MTVYALLTEKQTFLDANSNELSGGKLFVYLAGTTTKATSFAETDGVSANSNPIVLNSRGEVPNGLYVPGGATYKLVLAPATDTDPPTSPIWTRDNLTPTNDVSTASAVSEWITSTFVVSFSNGTTFTVSGDVTDTYQTNRRVRATIGSGNIYGRIDSSTFALGVTTVVVTWDSGALDATLTAVDYALLSGNNQSVPVPVNFLVRNTATIGGNTTVGATALAGERTLQVTNTDAGAGSAASASVQTNAGILQLTLDSTAAGGTATVLCSASGVFNIYTTQAQNLQLGSNNRADDIIITPAGVVLAGGVTSAPTNYTARGDIAIPAARGVRANNTAKAWVRFDGTPVGAYPITLTAVDSYGVASITKNAVADYTINFAAGIFADANYCAVGTAGSTSAAGFYTFRGPVQSTPTATAYRCRVSDSVPNYLDVNHISIAFFGD